MSYSNSHFRKLLTRPVNNLIKEIVFAVIFLSPIKDNFYKHHFKFSITDYAIGIIDVLRYNSSWRSYNGIIAGDTLRKKHIEWIELGVYNFVYESSLEKYFKKFPKTCELKYQLIDSSFVETKGNCDFASYSGIYKHKKGVAAKGISITSIDTQSGIPISVNIDPANKYDSTLLCKAIDNCVIDCNTKKYKDHNRYKQYFLADAGYDSKKNIRNLTKKGYVCLIKQNRRNIKNERLLRVMNKKQKEIYKKRIKIENYHSWIKKFCKISYLYETNIDNYEGLLLLAISLIIHRRLVR